MDCEVMQVRAIPGFSGYFAKADGTIWTISNGCPQRKDGFREGSKARRLSVMSDDGRKLVLVAELVLLAFVGPKPDGCVVVRGSLGRDSDALANVRWGKEEEQELFLPSLPVGINIALCPGYHGYAVDDTGTVWGCRHSFGVRWEIVRAFPDINGYPTVQLCRGNGNATRIAAHVHRLVLEAFVGPCPPKMEACHYPDPTRTNVALSNLHWGTRKTNVAERREHGNGNLGTKNPMSKLTDEDVMAMRRMRRFGFKCREIEELFGISAGHVAAVCSGRLWSHLPDAVPQTRKQRACATH